MSPVSRQSLKVTVNGRLYLVELGDLTTSPITVKVNGHPYQVDIETVTVEETPTHEREAALEMVARPTLAPEKATTPAAPIAPQANVVRAPMPGNILGITVKPGDWVSTRQQLCWLEAMKMKNAIRSPRDGVIASVEVSEGQAVAHGDALFTFADTQR